MTPAFALLLHLVRPVPDAAAIGRLAAGVSDWDQVTRLAQDHAVEQLAVRGLRSAELPVPERLRDAAVVKATQSLQLSYELIRVAQAFKAADLPYLAFKGPVESRIAYGNAALRTCRDIDLLVAPQTMTAALQVLHRLDYEETVPEPARQGAATWQIGLYRRQSRSMIDLHTRWTDVPQLFAWPFDMALRQHISVDIGDVPIATLPNEERLLFLCLHGSLHHWERLLWLCDLAWELSNVPWDAALLQQRAQQLGVSRGLQLGLTLAQRLFDAPLPAGLVLPAPGLALRHIEAVVMQRLGQAALMQPQFSWRRLAYDMVLRDSNNARLAELAYRRRRWQQR